MANGFLKINLKNKNKAISDIKERAARKYKDKIKNNITEIIDYFYGIATTPRPNIPSKTWGTISDPSAPYGVPVKTGKLQKSIKKNVSESGTKIIGKAWQDATEADYGIKVERGIGMTSPRPFFRPAMAMTEPLISKLMPSKSKK